MAHVRRESLLGGLFLFLPGFAAASGDQASARLQLRIGPECSVAVVNSTVSDMGQGIFTGATAFVYKIRTSAAGGSGAMEFQLLDETELEGTGGAARSMPAAPSLDYAVRLSGPAAAAPSQAGVSPLSAVTVATFGPNARSFREGAAGVLTWTLTNAPACGAEPCKPRPRLSIRCM